jgi:hypothetical protein
VHHCGTIKGALILLMHGANMKSTNMKDAKQDSYEITSEFLEINFPEHYTRWRKEYAEMKDGFNRGAL